MNPQTYEKLLRIKWFLKYPRKPSRLYFHRALDKLYSSRAIEAINYCHELKQGKLIMVDLPKRHYIRSCLTSKLLRKFEKTFDVVVIRKKKLLSLDSHYFHYQIIGYENHVEIAKCFLLYMYHTARTYSLALKLYKQSKGKPYIHYRREHVEILVRNYLRILEYWRERARIDHFARKELRIFMRANRIKRGWV